MQNKVHNCTIPCGFAICHFPRKARSTPTTRCFQYKTRSIIVLFHVSLQFSTRSDIHPHHPLLSVQNKVHNYKIPPGLATFHKWKVKPHVSDYNYRVSVFYSVRLQLSCVRFLLCPSDIVSDCNHCVSTSYCVRLALCPIATTVCPFPTVSDCNYRVSNCYCVWFPPSCVRLYCVRLNLCPIHSTCCVRFILCATGTFPYGRWEACCSKDTKLHIVLLYECSTL